MPVDQESRLRGARTSILRENPLTLARDPLLLGEPPSITPDLESDLASATGVGGQLRAIEDYCSANTNFQPIGGLLEEDRRLISKSVCNPKSPKRPLGVSPQARESLDEVRASVTDALAIGRFGDRELRRVRSSRWRR